MPQPPKPPKPRSRRPSSPPNTVSPGWLHEAAAEATLQTLRSATDGRLDVGTIADDFVSKVPGVEDGREPAELLARIYAHLAHRLPLVKRIEKRLEGRERTAGIGSDVLALVAQLYLRNRDLVPEAINLARAAAASRHTDGASASSVPGAPSAPIVPAGSGGFTTAPDAGAERTV